MKEETIINLLWTGGWDSTFRLCELVCVHRVKVQPYYLIDENRKSLREEMQAQSKIKAALFNAFPHTKTLILPTIFSPVSDLPEDNFTAEQYQYMKNAISLGSQYEWLANYCKLYEIQNLELGFEKTIGSKKHAFLKKYMIEKPDNPVKSYILDPKYKGETFYEFLKYYDWPIWLVTRDEMVNTAKKNGFYDILHLSWFCHNPIKGKPCGRCNPCKDIVAFGFKYRLPKSALRRYYLRSLSLTSLKKTIKKVIQKKP